MVLEAVNEERREKKRLMKELGLKTGKQYRKWVKNQRRIKRETNIKAVSDTIAEQVE